MMVKTKHILLIWITISFVGLQFTYGQVSNSSLKPCYTDQLHQQQMENNPAYAKQHMENQILLKKVEEEMKKNKQPKGTVYTIPVVFHVIHNGGPENVSSEEIFDLLEGLNRDFRMTNLDTGLVHSTFKPIMADVEIEFVIATKAPNGQCFSGITRTQSETTFESSGTNQRNAVINGNDVYQGEWYGDEYMNVFIVANADGAGGYTSFPNSTGMRNGIWLLYSQFRNRIFSHEVGHWLNLPHIWGNNNDPEDPSACSFDDGVDDTPRTIGQTDCSIGANTCSNDAIDGYWQTDVIDNVENYMNYSDCRRMFTQGQVDRMRAAITSFAGGRNMVSSVSNLIDVGAFNNAELCMADWKTIRQIVCEGDSVGFIDESYHNVSEWIWTFPGGSPSSSTAQNPKVYYATPGQYDVTLSISDGNTTISETKSNFITVLSSQGQALPIEEGFEDITSVPNQEWKIENEDGDVTFEITNVAAATDSKSLLLRNYYNDETDVDALISNPIDLSGVSSIDFTFKYAFARKTDSDKDELTVYASDNCGLSWSTRKKLISGQLGTANNTTSFWFPSASDFETVSVTTISSNYFVENFMFKIEFKSGGGNNLFIDDINISSPNVGIDEQSNLEELNVYPNPTDGLSNLQFSLHKQQHMEIELVDMVGRQISKVHTGTLQSGSHNLTIPTQNLSQGIYMLQINYGTNTISKKIVVE